MDPFDSKPFALFRLTVPNVERFRLTDPRIRLTGPFDTSICQNGFTVLATCRTVPKKPFDGPRLTKTVLQKSNGFPQSTDFPNRLTVLLDSGRPGRHPFDIGNRLTVSQIRLTDFRFV